MVTLPDNGNHGTIDSATVDIDQSALGSANFMKNLGAHEFGHVLGLDDDPRQGGMRTNVMDPDFNANDPFIGLSASDKMMLMKHYSVVPETSTFVMWAIGIVGLIGYGGQRRMGVIPFSRHSCSTQISRQERRILSVN